MWARLFSTVLLVTVHQLPVQAQDLDSAFPVEGAGRITSVDTGQRILVIDQMPYFFDARTSFWWADEGGLGTSAPLSQKHVGRRVGFDNVESDDQRVLTRINVMGADAGRKTPGSTK